MDVKFCLNASWGLKGLRVKKLSGLFYFHSLEDVKIHNFKWVKIAIRFWRLKSIPPRYTAFTLVSITCYYYLTVTVISECLVLLNYTSMHVDNFIILFFVWYLNFHIYNATAPARSETFKIDNFPYRRRITQFVFVFIMIHCDYRKSQDRRQLINAPSRPWNSCEVLICLESI